ncbi:MAG: hypothetical protein SFY66_01075 [Oculatellaceae cyanobacterium bins.114]|nr:hypothetical protein [Oculatellaceae cyanobacterium bins.114]
MVQVSAPLDYENHLELRLVKDKKPDPPKGNGATIVTVTVTVAITFALSLESSLIFPPPGSSDDPPATSVSFETGSGGGDKPTSVPPEELPFPATPDQKLQINDCNGVYYAGANFRVEPALTPLVIRGVVPEGEWVTLTGKTDSADGIIWYQATNDSELEFSIEPGAQNRTQANQTGWIAACFLD